MASKDAIAALRAGIGLHQLNFVREGMRDLTHHRAAYAGAKTRGQVNKIATGKAPTSNSRNSFDPIKLEATGNKTGELFALVDGRHRLQAALAAGATRISAVVDGKPMVIPIPGGSHGAGAAGNRGAGASSG